MVKLKSRRIISVLIIILLLSACLLVACGNPIPREVEKIAIINGSFKDTYNLDEVVSLKDAKIRVTYTDGTGENIPITQDMISGLSTAICTNSATLTVTYKEKTATFVYKVVSDRNIESAVRLKAEWVEGETNYISVKASGVANSNLAAVSFTCTANNALTLNNATLTLSSKWALQYSAIDARNVRVVIYSKTGYDTLNTDGEICKINAVKGMGNAEVYLQSASFSNGERDFTIPPASLEIK